MKVIRKKRNKQNFRASQFHAKTLPDDEIAEGISSLSLKQRELSNVLHTWAKDYVKCDGHDFEPVIISLSGSADTGQSHLLKVIYSAISVSLIFHCKDPENPRALLFGLTVNV